MKRRSLYTAPETNDFLTKHAALARRKVEPQSASLLALDEKRRALVTQSETLLAERNAASKQVGAAKAKGDDAEFERLRALVSDSKEKIAALESETAEADAALRDALMLLPNLPRDDIPDGEDEADNVEDKTWGTPPELGFEPQQHFDLGEAMGCMDFEVAAKLSGARFMLLSGALARLHRALAQFMLDTHIDKNGLTEYWTPVLVRDEAMLGTGQLPKFAEDSYRTTNGWWLIPTAEVTLTNTVSDEILPGGSLHGRYGVRRTQNLRHRSLDAGTRLISRNL